MSLTSRVFTPIAASFALSALSCGGSSPSGFTGFNVNVPVDSPAAGVTSIPAQVDLNVQVRVIGGVSNKSASPSIVVGSIFCPPGFHANGSAATSGATTLDSCVQAAVDSNIGSGLVTCPSDPRRGVVFFMKPTVGTNGVAKFTGYTTCEVAP